MSDWQQAMAELRTLVKQWVAEELRPTGVRPGVYGSVTVDAQGRVRYGAAAAGGGRLLALYLSGGQTINGGDEGRINFNTAIVSSAAVTTGALWRFTAPSTGKYMVHARVVGKNDTTDAGTPSSAQAGDNLWLILYYGTGTSPVSYQFLDHHQHFNSDSFYVMLHGTAAVSLTAGDTLNVAVQNYTSVSGAAYNTGYLDSEYIAIYSV
jgi:hypothetical protein